MIIAKDTFEKMINSPVRSIKGRVELYNGSTLLSICSYRDKLKEFKVERIGEKNKFFGYGICQKLTVELLDRNRELNITKDYNLEVEFGVDNDYIYPYPNFYIEEISRDENSNKLTVTAYDRLYKASQHKVSELALFNSSYSIREFAEACSSLLNIPMQKNNYESFDTVYSEGANFDGTETIRQALDYIAEVTQTVYYINNNWELVFKQLDIQGNPIATIDKTKYFTLNSKTDKTLTKIVHATELGDNVSAELTVNGSTQYIRDNPFWELREDIGDLVNNALEVSGGLTINQFICNWRGNYLLEIGDKIALTTKDNNTVISYILDDTVKFNGALSGISQWSYEDNDNETVSNPVSLGEVIKQTYARVDKANKQIDLVASETSNNSEAISALQINTDSISATVSKLENTTNDALDTINNNITDLTAKVNAQITAEDVKLEISKELSNGVNKVTTSTGFTFDDSGLTVEKTDSEMKTQITEDGMKVYKGSTEMLTANNIGVNAVNLHATTYLIIGNNSRFEDYDNNRTACFWIGGNS